MVDESAVAAPPEMAGRSATLDQHKSDGDVARRHRRVVPPCLPRIPRARARPIRACSVVVSSNAATLVLSLQPTRLSRWIQFRTRVGGHHTCLFVPVTSHKASASTTIQGEKSLDACSFPMRRLFLLDSPQNHCPNLPATLS